jgi:hypothetical protein
MLDMHLGLQYSRRSQSPPYSLIWSEAIIPESLEFTRIGAYYKSLLASLCKREE